MATGLVSIMDSFSTAVVVREPKPSLEARLASTALGGSRSWPRQACHR
jgi:hypothetical protein